jgi:hypothetical protein
MLLPIVLLLATAGSTQQAQQIDKAAILKRLEQLRAEAERSQIVPNNSGPNSFVHKPRPGNERPDTGIIISRPCDEQHPCPCASIRAHVFSDGENPQPLYVTDCPNLDVPYRTERAHRNVPENERQPTVKRTTD